MTAIATEEQISQSSLDQMLAFKGAGVLDGMEMFACRLGHISYVVTFDHVHPRNGWRASWQREGCSTTHLRKSFSSKKGAIAALRNVARRHAS